MCFFSAAQWQPGLVRREFSIAPILSYRPTNKYTYWALLSYFNIFCRFFLCFGGSSSSYVNRREPMNQFWLVMRYTGIYCILYMGPRGKGCHGVWLPRDY